MDRKRPLSHTGTEVSPTSMRHWWEGDSLLLDTCGITVSFYSLYFQVHPTVSHVNQGRGREKEGKLLHAFRQPSSPQSVLMWSSSSLCVSKKEEQKKRRGRVEGRGRGSFRVLMTFYTLSTVPNQSSPRGPRCSVPLRNLQVIRGPSRSTKGKKYCSWGISSTDQSRSPRMVSVRAGSLSEDGGVMFQSRIERLMRPKPVFLTLDTSHMIGLPHRSVTYLTFILPMKSNVLVWKNGPTLITTYESCKWGLCSQTSRETCILTCFITKL